MAVLGLVAAVALTVQPDVANEMGACVLVSEEREWIRMGKCSLDG